MAKKQTMRVAVPVEFYAETDRDIRRQRDDYALAALISAGAAFFVPDCEWDSYDDMAATCFLMAEAMMRERARRDAPLQKLKKARQ